MGWRKLVLGLSADLRPFLTDNEEPGGEGDRDDFNANENRKDLRESVGGSRILLAKKTPAHPQERRLD